MKSLPKSLKKPAPYRSSNGHTVEVRGWLLYHVTSASRAGIEHTVDLEGFEHWKTVCNCEAWKYGTRPCRHIAACLEFIAEGCSLQPNACDEWTDRLMFLLSMNHEFTEALLSPSLLSLRADPAPAKPKRNVRQYVLKTPRKYEATATATKRAQR